MCSAADVGPFVAFSGLLDVGGSIVNAGTDLVL